ncbi:MAG: long-chain fatty acid--CoA ligase [Desulfobacterales bacterium]|nr:long-chain fatty acid--CoA ligase [Desulfobacterales bacterium]
MNLAQYLEDSARNHSNRTAVRFEGQEVTFQELDIACNRMAGGLSNLGLGPGDLCVVMMPNSIHSITVYYALAKMGAIIVSVNFLYRMHELEHILTDSKPKAFIGSEPYLEEIRKALNKVKGPSIRLALGVRQDQDFKDLEDVYSDNKEFSTYPTDDNDTLNIIYTSGTTGVPKGVMLTHKNLARTAKILAEMRGSIDPKTVVIGALPLYHVYGITSVMNVSMYLGLTIELFPLFEPEKVIQVIEEEEQTIFFGVPTMLNRLIRLASESPPKRASLRFCISGGASLPVEFLHRFETLFKTKIHEGYGLSEAPVCVENPYGKVTKPGSIGLPIPEFSARIVDNDENDVPQGEVGELLIKGPGVMKGYLNRPEETRETIKDGWLYTGDIARMDEDHYIYIVDRKKELVIRGGYNVYPREIEEVLYQIPDIVEAAVFGIPHEDLGEEVAAVLVLKEAAQIGTRAIQDYVKERVAPYKYPRIIKIVKEPLPKTGSGKILKKEVKEQYSSLK